MTRMTATLATMTLLSAVGGATPAAALQGCRARIAPSSGTVQVFAARVSGRLRWGERDGAEQNEFENAAQCLAGGQARACRLGAPGTPEGMSPPDLCRIFLRDDDAACVAYVRGCTPGVRAASEAVQALLSALTLEDGGATIRVSGLNLQIVSGSGRTDGPANGRGNLIVGYNGIATEIQSPARTGSHNVVVGDGHVYTSFGGLVAGRANTIIAPFATVAGGELNAAREAGAVVVGGKQNSAEAEDASILGGQLGQADGTLAAIAGGGGNKAHGVLATVAGGRDNAATGDDSSVSGGAHNRAADPNSSVSGGQCNGAGLLLAGCTVSGGGSSVSGGSHNLASGANASVSGGTGHAAFDPNGWGAGSLFADQ